jgi:hypothetical protein
MEVVEDVRVVAGLLQPAAAVGEPRDHPVRIVHLELDRLILRFRDPHFTTSLEARVLLEELLGHLSVASLCPQLELGVDAG